MKPKQNHCYGHTPQIQKGAKMSNSGVKRMPFVTQTDRQTDRQTEREKQTDRQRQRQTERQTGREIDRQTD